MSGTWNFEQLPHQGVDGGQSSCWLGDPWNIMHVKSDRQETEASTRPPGIVLLQGLLSYVRGSGPMILGV